MSDSVSQVDWDNAPEDAQFYSGCVFRKQVNYEEYFWYVCGWEGSIYADISFHEEYYRDFQMRPVITPERMDKTNSVEVAGLKDLIKNSPEQAWGGVMYKDGVPVDITYDLGQPVGVLGQSSGAIKTSIDFLEEVKSVQSQRAAEYEQDGGERSFDKIATVFNTYTGKDLQPSDVALILEILKNVRFYAQDGYHSDSVVDKISYSSLWAELVTKERT